MNNINVLKTGNEEQSKINPSVLAFEQELENILLKFAKRNSSGDGYQIRDDIGKRKLDFSRLFKEFKPRLQHHYFMEKLMQIGSFLYSIKAFQLAKFQCFTRYLQEVSANFTCIESVAENDFQRFQDNFFSNGLDDAQAVDTIKVVYEDAMCSYEMLSEWDPKLQNTDSVNRCLKLLKVLMLTTQLALHEESFSWLVYNGTIHIYTISRQLMVTGRSNLVLEYMLWACMCMEGSIPLLTLKYIPWRSTLYATVCLCYLDCKQSRDAETFARRAMEKITELADIEEMSTSVSTPETKAIFQAAKVKINVLIFQRVVFESRKRPKGLLRPKLRAPLREALNSNWPRNQTERLLADKFEGTAAQFLAILQTLGDPHRRTLHCKAPTGSIDDITLDIYPELFVAGVDLITGGNNARLSRFDPEVNSSSIELSSTSLLDLSEQGIDGVPLPFVVKFIKLAFSYEQWEVFEAILQPFFSLLKTRAQVVQTPAYVISLQLLVAMEPFFNTVGRKQAKKSMNENTLNENSQGNKGASSPVDELLVVANILNGFSSELPKSSLPYVDVDMIIDATLFLWNRCKPYFQRVVSSNQDSCRHVLNDKDCDKWLFILLTIDNVLHWSGLSDVDPIVTAEVALKLALILECRASTIARKSNAPSLPKMVNEAVSCDHTKADENPDADDGETESKPYQVVFPNTYIDLLYMAFNILESGVERVSDAREKMAKLSGDGPFQDTKTNQGSYEGEDSSEKPSNSSKSDVDIQIIHLELLFNLTRMLAKLENGPSGSGMTLVSAGKSKSSATISRAQVKNSKSQDNSWTADLVKKYNKLPLTRALLLMHTTQIQDTSNETAQQNLQICYDIIKKSRTQEKVLASRSRFPNTDDVEATAAPPPPILVFRTSTRITLRPAPFKPLCQKKVYWYRLFGCSASGSNVKVRLNDSDLRGTGIEVPVEPNCRFYVTNLNEGERYVFAVAAYDKNGDLIGGGIGPTSQACPASHPMPMIMAWTYLTQAAYTCGVYDIARASAQVLWKYFVRDENKSNEKQLSFSDCQLTLDVHRCDQEMLTESNQSLVRQFLQSVFISVDIAVQDGKLYCDSLCDYGALLPGQILRMRQCEKMLLVLQTSLWLNDNSMVLQSLTRCYGLVAPLLQLKIPSKPVLQVLLQCYAVIQEIPTLNRFRKNSMTYDSLYHLIAVITHYLTKMLPIWGEKELANTIKEYGRKLLTIDTPTELVPTVSLIISQDGPNGSSSQQQIVTKPKKKEGKNKAKKAKGGVVKVNTKPEQSNKTGTFQKNEFTALETIYTKRTSQAMVNFKNDYELTGAEDPIVLTSYVTALTANEGYKEVMKFKRRTKYLQYFVMVVEKALANELVEKVLEWSNDTEVWLNRRNDILMPSTEKPSIARQSSDFEGDETKNKKFATAIIEFGKPAAKKNTCTKSMRQLLETLAEIKDPGPDTTSPPINEKPVKPVKNASTSPARTPPNVPRIIRKGKKKARPGNEQDLIRAIEALQSKLPWFWKTEGKKRKLRAITAEENPWRCQWNIIRASASFLMFLKNAKKTDRSSNDSSNLESNVHVLDSEWFGFDISGVLIRGRNSILKESPSSFKNLVISMTERTNRQSPLKKKEHKEQLRIDEETEYLRYVYNAAKYLSKAVVLSYRCKCWGLLQNACSQLWNLRQKLFEFVVDPSSQIADDVLFEITWSAFYFAADMLLDMLLYIKQNKKETSKAKTKASDDNDKAEVSFWGDIEMEKGGYDLIFEQYLDEQTTADVVWIKRIIMHCMEVLFYKEKWEKLVDIILRFNALSRGRYAEKVLPLLVFAQEKLLERAEQHGGISSTQPDVVLSADSGKPEGQKINLNAGNASFEPGVHIDPKGHDVYSDDNNAQRLFCVPVDKTSTLQLLKQSVELKHCAARALQHSRELFLRYLAGLGQHLKKSPSRVAFVSTEDQSLTAAPSNITELKFDKIDDIQKCPLTSSQLAIVVTSYDKTIEMLQFHGRRALLAQAMNEIGNIMLHIGNKRSAYRWWQTVLDTILSPVSQSEHGQTSHNRYHDAVHVEPSVLLKKRGMWGCLLAAVTAVNIARYIQTDNADKRLDYCCVAASLIKAIYSCSLPHPTSSCDFALYDIGNGFPVGTLIPGINLFSDPFRCDAKVLLSSTIWLAEELIDTGHYLTVLPLLTLARYISSDVFENEHWITKVLILRIRALTKAGMFSHSYHVLNTLLLGKNVKKTQKSQNFDSFYSDKPLNDESNIPALTNLISNRLSPTTVSCYGTEASRCLMLEQARLLIEIAACVYAIPRNVKTELVEKLQGETCETSALEVSKTSNAPIIKVFEDDVSQVTIKSYLLAGAELLLEELRQEILGSQMNLEDFLDARGHLFKPVEFKTLILVELELANILHQYMESLCAAKAIYECMRSLEEASVLLEHDATRLGSAWTAFSRSPDLAKTPDSLRSDVGSVKSDIDANLWLTCRMKIVEYLFCEENSVGRIAGFSRSVVALTGSAEQHCEQGLDESEAFGHSEIVAQFQFGVLLLKLKAGSLTQEGFDLLKNTIGMLKQLHPLSMKGSLLLVKMLIYYGDIAESFGATVEESCESYRKAESILNEQILALGHNIHSSGSNGTSRSNDSIYLPHNMLLAETKLRCGRVKLQNIDSSSETQTIRDVLSFLMEGLGIVTEAKMDQNPLESEFLFLIGVCQRYLWGKGECSDGNVITPFIDSITKTYSFDHNLELMRKCYEQLALFYFAKTEHMKNELVKQAAKRGEKSPKLSRAVSKVVRKDTDGRIKDKHDLLVKRETKKELRAIWIAARAIATLTAVIDTRGQLHGNVTGLFISKATGQKIPLPVIHDLLGCISIKCDEEGQHILDDGIITMESWINSVNTVQLTWNHLLSYIEYLQRQVSYQSLGVKTHGGPLYRWTKLLKLHQMHEFLGSELEVYVKKGYGVKCSPLLLLPDLPVKPNTGAAKLRGRSVEDAGENEISISWMSSNLLSKRVEKGGDYVECIYAFNNKAISGVPVTGVSAGRKTVLRKTLVDVHQQLQSLLEMAENDNTLLQTRAKPDAPPVSSGTPQTPRKKKVSTIRMPSGHANRVVEVQSNLRGCLIAVTKMMRTVPLVPEKAEKKDIPFEVSHTNVRILESVFNPSRGYIGKVPDSVYQWISSMFV